MQLSLSAESSSLTCSMTWDNSRDPWVALARSRVLAIMPKRPGPIPLPLTSATTMPR